MKISIICAMQEELDSILHALEITQSHSHDPKFVIYSGIYRNTHQLTLSLCGIGKVNAALHTQHIIDKFAPDYVINVGVAGGLDSKLDFGDVVIAKDLVQHDMDVRAFDLPKGQVPRLNTFAFASDDVLLNIAKNIMHKDFKVALGTIATGDQFIADVTTAKKIQEEFKAAAVEMEGAAIAHVCYVNQTPFLVVRAISDKAGIDHKKATHSFVELKEMVAKRSSLIVSQILNTIK
jgi:adenosylhomocysteine nucleosidase